MPRSTQGNDMRQDHRFAIRLAGNLFEKLKIRAAKNRRSIAEQTRIFIEKGLGDEK
jgi:plasmid stability protein